ncbi:2-oxoacid:acceptor oxidoreductase subunit alpha [Acidiplasma sp.]|uniref:2-oxoacid:acceptor oxidoreductase subunit alpha n=1 Tax=Acidiplasma sp. TaxID=1872114 RepID=UPI0025827968|nr:2-oxoacid:acceptor oxidoreductase subunit alpha [Acidiplasma sp.]
MESTVIRIGGAAGDGVQSAGLILAKSLSRNGLYISTYNYYQSLIRGGESWYQVRASENVVKNQGSGLDILIALNEDALNRHTNPGINEGGASPLSGIAIFDGEMITNYKKYQNIKYCPIPLRDIALKYDKNSLLKNTVALGATIAALGLGFDTFSGVIQEVFGKKGKVAELNVSAAKDGYDYYLKTYGIFKKLHPVNRKLYIASGGEAVGLGAVNAGMQMYFAYPMTPASSALHFFANHAKKYNLFVKVTEDEISAINAAIGANYAGVRAMTGTSGGGFALMSEAVGLAGMTEVPLVIYEAQRPGPSTGLPTKTEQGDLNQILGAGQGDFPRIVLAPGNVTEAFDLAKEAFNLAAEYQLPVFIMSDLYLAEHVETLNNIDLTYKMEHGLIAQDNDPNFKRYEFTESGISKRAIPGQKGLMHNEDSDEHDEYGNVVSDEITDPKIRSLSMEKRMRKLETYKKNMPPTNAYRADGAENLIIQWGSTKGVVEEIVDDLIDEGFSIGALEINHVYPLNPDIAGHLKNRNRIIVVENNFSGQLNRLIKSEFLVKTEFIGKYDGEAFYPDELKARVRQMLNIQYENVKIGGDK